MAAVHENSIKRPRRLRQTNGRRSALHVCNACNQQTKWLSVDGMCWNCTIKAARNKTPLHNELFDDETDGMDSFSDYLGAY